MKPSSFLPCFGFLLSCVFGGLLLGAPLPAAADDRALLVNAFEIIGERTKHDIVVVDKKQTILLDTVSANVGKIFDEDKGDEVGKTIADGKPRSFLESGKDFPKGIRHMVYPVKNAKGEIIGAVIVSVFMVAK